MQILQSRLALLEARIGSGQVSVCRGGTRRARNRHDLDAAGIDKNTWRKHWQAHRLFLTADGEADKRWGNETIRLHPDEAWVELKLPALLSHLANRPHDRGGGPGAHRDAPVKR